MKTIAIPHGFFRKAANRRHLSPTARMRWLLAQQSVVGPDARLALTCELEDSEDGPPERVWRCALETTNGLEVDPSVDDTPRAAVEGLIQDVATELRCMMLAGCAVEAS